MCKFVHLYVIYHHLLSRSDIIDIRNFLVGGVTPVTGKRLKFSSHRLSVPELFAKWEAAMKDFRDMLGIGQDMLGTFFFGGGEGGFTNTDDDQSNPKKWNKAGWEPATLGLQGPIYRDVEVGRWSNSGLKAWIWTHAESSIQEEFRGIQMGMSENRVYSQL